VPFGGFKQSGIGRESITDTIREMSHETAIVLNQQPTLDTRLLEA
jgi:glyceraldehyde-3-phosphate dehydrogenase (NADP+)